MILTSRRSRRVLSLAIAAGATATVLTGCTKPQPSITVFSGSTSKTVSAQPECVLTSRCNADAGKVSDLNAAPGSTILVDVPKTLASAGWIVTAFTQDSSSKNTPIDGAGSSITNNHTVRLQVPQAGGAYFLQVSPPALTQSAQDNRLTTWIVRVQLAQ
ncbi:MAG TPA: DUF2771 family protein [Jatrophihabitans sp.]